MLKNVKQMLVIDTNNKSKYQALVVLVNKKVFKKKRERE